LTADHDTIPITIGLRTWNYGRYDLRLKAAHALKEITNLLALNEELSVVRKVLVLASATYSEIRTKRSDPVRGRLKHLNQACMGKPFVDLENLGLHYFSAGHEWNENDDVLEPANPLAAERNIGNRQRHSFARRQIHTESLPKATGMNSRSLP
jgi:hypothetical protein